VSDQLSQDEVQALLRGLEDGDVTEQPATAAGDARAYDLVNEGGFVGRRFQALDLAQERLARRLRQSLGNLLGTPPEVEPAELEVLKFSVFRNRLPTPSSLHLFSLAPLRGQALAIVSPPLAFGLIDRVFGGPGSLPEGASLERELSAIETQMLQRVVTMVVADLADAWAPIHAITGAFVRSELNPASLSIAGPNDMMVVLGQQCDIGTGPAPLTLAIPFAMIEPLRAKLGEPESIGVGPDSVWVHAMSRAVQDVDVEVHAELGGSEITTRELLRLKAGDLITLRTRADDPLEVCIEGRRLLAGSPGVSRGNNAVRVVGRV
jgi:flagellar motor switch protein FliM